jgi:DNA-binding transcriptional LysR family regulator
VKVKPRLWSNNGDTCISAAENDLGIQLQPTFLVAQELASGQLVEILPEYQSAELGIYAIYPSGKFVLSASLLIQRISKTSRLSWIYCDSKRHIL